MKNFFKFLFAIGESIGKARAATYFTRQGNYEAARKIIQG